MRLDASFAADASANAANDLTTLRIDGTWYWRRRLGLTAAVFSTTGSADAGLYSADPGLLTPGIGVITSASNKPDTSGWMAEVNYVPWLNVKLSLQYTAYSKFNGGSSNYDGFGRNASDNNTAYALLWFAY